MPPVDDNGLTDAEQKFFETGDSSVLGISTEPEPEPAPVEDEPQPTAAPAPEPEVSPMELALEHERARARDLERRLSEMEANKPAPQEEPLPDEGQDPLGHMIERMKRMGQQYADLQRQLIEEQQKATLRQQYEEFASNVRAIKDDFTKTHTDFDAAYTHLRNIKLADLTDSGISKTEAIRRLNQEELQLAASALERGKNPAEVIYGMAKRYGFSPSAAPTTQKQQQAEEKVTRLANGQFASRAPQRAAPPANKELTSEGLKDASDRDLNSIVMDDKTWKQIVGGQAGGDIFHH